VFIDDIGGSAVEGTVRFGLDGTQPGRSLCGRPAGSAVVPAALPGPGAGTGEHREHHRVREWAKGPRASS
jgi:hypothetical protein